MRLHGNDRFGNPVAFGSMEPEPADQSLPATVIHWTAPLQYLPNEPFQHLGLMLSST